MTDTFDRSRNLHRLAAEHFDVLVVGGGITGVAVAHDAALRGLRVALVEKADFASGTSSYTSKMVHGGLRYLEQRNVGLVRHSLLERQRLYRNAPHLVRRLPFLFPLYDRGGVISPRLARAFGLLLWVYDGLGSWRIGRLHRRLTRAEVLVQCPTLTPAGLRGGFRYYDTRVDDARLTLTMAQTAATHGAVLVNYAVLEEVSRDGSGPVTGAVVSVDGHRVEVRARVVVNAGGVWADDLDAIAAPGTPARMRAAKGVHVVVPWERVRNEDAVLFPIQTTDGAKGGTGFVVRWGDRAYLGTTDTPYDGDLDTPLCTAREARLLLDSLNATTGCELGIVDVVGSFAGLRPLLDTGTGQTAEIRRSHEVTSPVDGLFTISGGKLTVARHMAEQTVDAAQSYLGRSGRCRTRRARLLGGAGFDAESVDATGGRAAHLGGRYGTLAHRVQDLVDRDPSLGRPLVEGLPYLRAEALYAIRFEMARTVDDVLSRRTRAHILARDASLGAVDDVAAMLEQETDQTADQVRESVQAYRSAVGREVAALAGSD